jgi:hypothetical protein
VTGGSEEEISLEVNRILEPEHRMMQNMCSARTGEHVRLQFDVAGKRKEQEQLLRQLKESKVFRSVTSLGPVDRE